MRRDVEWKKIMVAGDNECRNAQATYLRCQVVTRELPGVEHKTIFDRSRLLGGDVTLAVRRSGGAVALCSFTTTVGYGSLLFADNQALQSFGRLAMSGELLAILAAMLVLPSMLHVWRNRTRPT